MNLILAMGRKILADPGLPNKIISGQEHLIRPCIYRYVCVSQIFINKPMKCAVNSQLGNEHRNENIIHSTSNQKKILVSWRWSKWYGISKIAQCGHRVEYGRKIKTLEALLVAALL